MTFLQPSYLQRAAGTSHRIHRSLVMRDVYGGLRILKSRKQQRAIRSRTVMASVFGVGAPEAALVGVVALVVFGPQGLIEAAKSTAATIRSFQPAIQEINQASSEIRTSITSEMGIDRLQKEFREISQTTRDSLSLNPDLQTTASNKEFGPGTSSSFSSAKAASDSQFQSEKQEAAGFTKTALSQQREEYEARVSDPSAAGADHDIEMKRKESVSLAWGAKGVPTDVDSAPRRLEDMSLAELQKELKRRQHLIKAIQDLNT